tara:strand:+ start:6265 stop:6630 length:366 start_codon:yes stop_codon:yes gene_type:complete
MTANPNNLMTITWDAPSFPAYATCDAVVPGFLFGGEELDSSVERYEIEVYNNILHAYVNKGYFYTNQAEFRAADLGDAKVRIRAITRENIKSDWAESGTFSLYGFTTYFGDVRNTIFLSFV